LIAGKVAERRSRSVILFGTSTGRPFIVKVTGVAVASAITKTLGNKAGVMGEGGTLPSRGRYALETSRFCTSKGHAREAPRLKFTHVM